MTLHLHSLLLFSFLFFQFVILTRGETCVVQPNGKGDDTPALLDAFRRCGQDGKIELLNKTYNIGQVMNTTNLRNCRIDLKGTLLWSKDIDYWLNHSMPIGYQNQSTVWFLGGENITFNGFGTGTLDGNGQEWYEFVKGISNYPRRPMGLTIWNAKNSVFRDLRFVKSQMWTMTIMHSSNIVMENIYINSSSSTRTPARNTDGADTLYSDNLTFRGWTIANGDDGISLKANTTNVLIEDSTFHGGAVALGSIGQYADQFETIENVVFRNSLYEGSFIPAYVKTWTGKQKGYPPNGGGGGLGFISNITVSNITLTRASGVFGITQCTHFSSGGVKGDCDTSKFSIHDITVSGIHGNVTKNSVASLKCSPAAPCSRLKFDNIDVVVNTTGKRADKYSCLAVKEPLGWECTDSLPLGE